MTPKKRAGSRTLSVEINIAASACWPRAETSGAGSHGSGVDAGSGCLPIWCRCLTVNWSACPSCKPARSCGSNFWQGPDHFNVQKLAWTDELSVLPYYDPVWASSSHSIPTPSSKPILRYGTSTGRACSIGKQYPNGDAGLIKIGEDRSIYAKLQPVLWAAAIGGGQRIGDREWQQQAVGVMDITNRIVSQFHATGSAYGQAFPKVGGINGITPRNVANPFTMNGWVILLAGRRLAAAAV